MQIDVNSPADRVHLMRAQLTAARSAPLNPAPVSTNGRAFTDLASAPGKPPVTLTDLASARGMTVSDTRGRSSLTLTFPRPELATRPANDPGSLVQTEPNNPPDTALHPEPISDLDALLKDWGKTDSPYDLDGNGIVGINDLLMLLANWGGESPKPHDPPGDVPADPTRHTETVVDRVSISEPASADPKPTSDLDALLADWGKTDSPYDLDGNGIVGINDLLILLANWGDDSQPPQRPHGDVLGPGRAHDRVLAETLARRRAPHDPPVAPGRRVASDVRPDSITEWVTNNQDQDNNRRIDPAEVDGSRRTLDLLDRNHDGTLSRSELASRIRDMLMNHLARNPKANLHQFVQAAMKRLSDYGNADKAPNRRNPPIERSSSVYRQANLQATARQLMQGLTDHGAMELRNFVQEGKLSANDRRTVLDQINRLRPDAQRVNLVG